MVVRNINGNWCFVPEDPSRDKSCFGPGEKAKAKAIAMLRAVLIAKEKKKGKDSVEIDALFKDQILAKEGVLKYWVDGKEIRMVKKWDDLKQNIGRTLLITIEHPDQKNKNGGLHNEEDIVGVFGPVSQYQDKHILIGDKYVEDGVDPLKGQSGGFTYIPIAEDGELNGDLYDMVQSDLWYDHLALTKEPREPFALHTDNPEVVLQLAAMATGGDSQDHSKNTLRTKYWIGYDNIESSKNQSNQPNKKIKKVDSIMSEDPTKISESEAEVRAENAKLKAEKATADSFKKQLDDLKKEKEQIEKERDAEIQKNKTRREQDVSAMVDSIKNTHGFPEDFVKIKTDGLTDEQKEYYVRGMCNGLDHANKLWSKGSDVSKGTPAPQARAGDNGDKPDINMFASFDFTWNFERNRMEDPLGNPPKTEYDSNWKVLKMGN
jgi:Skp family chaperone for outer membrane proteins